MFRSEGAGVLRPKRAFLSVGGICLALIPAIIALAVVTGIYPLAITLVHAILFGSMALSYGFRSTKGAKMDEGTLRVDERAISVGGHEVALRSELKGAFIVPTAEGTLVHLERKGRLTPSVFVRVRDEDEARALLRELGFDAAHTAAQMRIASGLLAMPLWKQMAFVLTPIFFFVPMMAGAAAAHNAYAMMGAVLTLLTYVFSMAFAPTTVRIGTDGIVTRWLGRMRFIAHSEIARADTYDDYIAGKRQLGVLLTLKSHAKIRLPTGQMDIGRVEAQRLAHRIEEAREANARGATTGTTDMLARGERALADWVRYLRAMGAGAVGPRVPAVPQDVLLRVVEDSKAAPLERASAAVAAVASGDDDAKKRVRIAADATASPKLRVALERISSDTAEEAALEEALTELDEERAAS